MQIPIRLAAATLLGLSACSGGGSDPGAAAGLSACSGTEQARLSADFGSMAARTPTGTGFLWALDGSTPGDAKLTPLRPRHWRAGSMALYDRASALGARFTIVLGDAWGVPGKGGTRGWPFDDWTAWETFVRSWAQAQAAAGRGSLGVDLWNEPDTAAYWQGTAQQFYETYARAEPILRAELGPGARIGGPSTVAYNSAWTQGLLDHCVAQGCTVDFLSWHEFGLDTRAIRDHLGAARAAFVDHSAYAALGIDELIVNEFVGQANHYRPAAYLSSLGFLEAGGADGANKACWGMSDGVDSCRSDRLDGLLNPAGNTTAVWWAAKWYADGTSTRAGAASSDEAVATALASRGSDQAGQAQVLVAHYEPLSTRSVELSLRLDGLSSVSGLAGLSTVAVTIDRLPYGDSGLAAQEAGVAAPQAVSSTRLSVSADGASLCLGGVAAQSVWRIRVGP